MTPDEEDQSQPPRHSPTAKRSLSPDSTDSLIKKQRHDPSQLPPPSNADTANSIGNTSDQTPFTTVTSTNDALKDTPLKPTAEKQDDTLKDSAINCSSTGGEILYQETFSVVGEEGDDVDIEITTSVDEDSSAVPLSKDLNEPLEHMDAATVTDEQVPEGQNKSTKQVDVVPAPANDSLEAANKAQTTAFSSPGAAESAPSQSATSSTLTATSRSAPSTSSAIAPPPPQPTATASSSSPTKDNSRINIIDRSSAVRLPFSDKFFFTDEAYEAYSYDSFTATIERMTRNSRPGLAISSDPPKSHTDSSSLSAPPTSRIHRPTIPKAALKRRTDDDTSDHGNDGVDHDNLNATIHKQPSPPGNMLDSLLDSISKNDRPVKQAPPPPPPPPMRQLSDLEIAMQAADLPSQEQS